MSPPTALAMAGNIPPLPNWRRRRQLEMDDADVIGVDGEPTRPGAEEVNALEELECVIPVITSIHQDFDVPISIYTTGN